MNKRLLAYSWFLIALLACPLLGQGDSKSVVKGKGHVSVTAIRPGDKFKLGITLDVAKEYHVNAHVPTLEYVIPTTVEFTAPAGITIGEVQYPEPELKSFGFAPDTKLAVHEGIVVFTADAAASTSLQPGSLDVPARIRVQACNDELCLAPGTIDLIVPLQV